MRRETISDETRTAILDAAWALMVNRQMAGAGMAAVAAAAGVTRQTVYLAFGSRVGLLVAMARRADQRSAHSRRMARIAAEPAPDADRLLDFVDAWLSHLPEIFPVGRILLAAAATDPDAAAVLADRLEGSLHARFLHILRPLAAQGRLRAGLTAAQAADLCWSLTHLDAWRHLVVEHGWTPEAFRASRREAIAQTVLAPR